MLRFAVGLDAASRHLAEVTLRFPVEGDRAEVAMPAWSPGSYLIRDYARWVRDFSATAGDGSPRKSRKIDKATWEIDADGARELVVRYAVYGHELSVRTSHIDAVHAYLHPPATFMCPAHLRGAPASVEVAGHVTCPLAWEPTSTLRAATIDELYDSPIHVGPVRAFKVPAKRPVRLVVYGARAPGGTFDEERLAIDLGAAIDDQIARFGEAPYEHYTCLLMLAHDAYGGLEHRASSVNVFHPHFAASRKAYENLLELLAHEHFHVWNGKRITPRGLADVDYAREAYTPNLWVIEGLTSHYDRYTLRRAGCITVKSFLDKLLDDWARLQSTPGRTRHSLEAASFDAWIKLYRPDESNLNTTVSYYMKGGLAMAVLDLEIRRRTEDARSLDDVLRSLWQRYGATGIAYPDDVQPIFEEAAGLSLAQFFEHQIRGTADPDLPGELAHLGLELHALPDPNQVADGAHAVWLGATMQGVKVTGVFDGGPAQAAGLSPADEVIAVDGFRATSESELRNLVGARKPGDRVILAVFRRHRLLEIPMVVGVAPSTRYEIAGLADPGPGAERFRRWLGEPHPGTQTLATVTTTTRWI